MSIPYHIVPYIPCLQACPYTPKSEVNCEGWEGISELRGVVVAVVVMVVVVVVVVVVIVVVVGEGEGGGGVPPIST